MHDMTTDSGNDGVQLINIPPSAEIWFEHCKLLVECTHVLLDRHMLAHKTALQSSSQQVKIQTHTCIKHNEHLLPLKYEHLECFLEVYKSLEKISPCLQTFVSKAATRSK